MTKVYKCLICGYIHRGEAPPESCPICGASAQEFELMEEKLSGAQPEKPGFETTAKPGQADLKDKRIVIIGGGIAGLTTAEEVRKHSKNARITLVTNDRNIPYYRLNITRYLAKEVEKESLPIYPASWYEENGIELVLGREAEDIDREARKVYFDDGSALAYDTLVIATGAQPFVPPIKGSSLKNVMTVRTVEDADYLQDKLKSLNSCICIGGGILGLEMAGSIARRGIKVKVLEVAPWLMPRQLNKKAAEEFSKYLMSIGLDASANINVKEISGDGVCEKVELDTGEQLKAELVVITAGVTPDTRLAKKAGLVVNKGLVVNNRMQTSDSKIYAAGDVAEHDGVLYGLWPAAQYQAKIAGMNIAGIDAEFGGIPRSNVLKVLGIDLFSIGEINPEGEGYTVLESKGEDRYLTFVLKGRDLVGGIVMGDKDFSMKLKKAVESGFQLSEAEAEGLSAEKILSLIQ